MDALSVQVIRNAVVYPTVSGASHPDKILMSVADSHGDYVNGTLLNRRFGDEGAPVPPELFPEIAESADRVAIYLGPLYSHFGHFLLESLARAWYALRYPALPLVWVVNHDRRGTVLRPWQQEMLELLMINNPTRIVADPFRFEVLHVPDIGCRYDDQLHPDHASFLGRYDGPAQVPGHKLWLSRSSIATRVRDLNSSTTERRLARAGWTIAHPEALTIRQQVEHLSRAEIIAGEEGSALHTLLLLKDITSKEFHIFRRRGQEHRSLHTIGDVRHVNQTFYSLKKERVIAARGRVVSKITPNASEILDHLGVPMPCSLDLPTRSSDDARLERIVASTRPNRYLEIGATAPHVVVGSTAPVRVSICPRFDFDPRSYRESAVAFYELDLAAYINHFHGDRAPFDVIRIDGSNLEELMTSFRLSQNLAHEDTWWIFGLGEAAALAALTVHLSPTGFKARRRQVHRRLIYLIQRAAVGSPDNASVADLTPHEIDRHLRRLRPLLVPRRTKRR